MERISDDYFMTTKIEGKYLESLLLELQDKKKRTLDDIHEI